MRNPVVSVLLRTSRRGGLLVLLALLFLLMYGFHGLFPFSVEKIGAVSGGMGIPDARMYYTYAQLYEMFRHYGPEGRRMYLQLQWVDWIYPLVYSLILASLLFVVYKKTRLRYMVYVPFMAALFDYVENILLRVSILSFPHMHKGIVQVAGTVTFTKWFLIFVTFFLLVFGAFWKLGLWFRSRKRTTG